MAKIDLSVRDRHAIKWHLNMNQFDRVESRRLDKVFEALKLDDVATAQNTDPYSLDVALLKYDLTSDERDFLIDNLQKPALGYVKRLLNPIERALIKSRDGETSETK